MAIYKIVVTGPFNSGKTEFVRTGSDIDAVVTEKRITTEDRGIKAETTVAMDFGRIELGNDLIHLYGTPGQTRFSFMWEILAKEMNGFIVLVDSSDIASFPEAADLIEQFSGYVDVPYVVVANKFDLDDAADDDVVREGTRIADSVPILHCTATDKNSVRRVVDAMINML